MPKSKFQIGLEAEVAAIPDEELANLEACPTVRALLLGLLPKTDLRPPPPKITVPISTCKQSHISSILGLDTSKIRKESEEWQLPDDVERIKPSTWLLRGLKNSEDFWFRNSENGTRTRIDLILLDTLRQLKIARPAETSKMSAWTEISLSWPSETVELSGRGDYFIGYSSSENAEDALQTLLMAGEAKVLDGEKNLWQIIAYCGILHLLRKQHLCTNSTIYGFITDSRAWEFVWVDNNGVIVNSAVISEISEVQTWLSYIIINARSSTPTAIPKMSLEDLSKFAVKIERFTTATSSSKEELVVDEDELRAFEQEFKRQLALSAKKAAKA